jgi:Xaa-Pro aminopeptidase
MAKLIYADSNCSDMLYASKATLADPTFYVDTGSERIIFLDLREIKAFEEHNQEDGLRAELIDPFIVSASQRTDGLSLIQKLALHIIDTFGLREEIIEVGEHLPLSLADCLRSAGIRLEVKDPLFPEREIKSLAEVGIIRDNLVRTQAAFLRIETLIREAKIGSDGVLIYEGVALTSERLKKECDLVLLEQEMIDVVGMIISSGAQAAIPHHHGSGTIRAGETIICDLFPRNRQNGYFADMTRTYIKGQASEKLMSMYEEVRKVQELAIAAIAPGKNRFDIYKLCVDTFVADGWNAGDKGFVHGLGHGLGLDIHESPRANATASGVFEPGHVMTVEPGLYYPELGGVRIEDVVVVEGDGCRNLTDYPKVFVID